MFQKYFYYYYKHLIFLMYDYRNNWALFINQNPNKFKVIVVKNLKNIIFFYFKIIFSLKKN